MIGIAGYLHQALLLRHLLNVSEVESSPGRHVARWVQIYFGESPAHRRVLSAPEAMSPGCGETPLIVAR